MLIIFNQSGNEFNVDFQYDSFSQGDTNTHIIDVIVEDTTFSNYEYNGYVQFLREGETEPSPKLIMATKRFNYNGNYYSGYTFAMESDWFTAIAGTLKMTIEIKKFSNSELQSNKAYGVVNIPVQPSVSSQAEVDSVITDEEYTAMVQLINSKLNVDDYDIEKSWYDSEEDFADNCITEVMQENGKRKVFFTSIGDAPTRYEAIGLVNQQNGTYYCVVYSPTGTSLYKRTLSDDYVTKINYKTSATIFEAEGATPPIHLKSNMPYVVSDTPHKVGMRAYTEDGEMAGQFAVGYDEEYDGHFANMQARCSEDEIHTFRVSHRGPTYHINKGETNEVHNIPFDENVVHKEGNETINGTKTFTAASGATTQVFGGAVNFKDKDNIKTSQANHTGFGVNEGTNHTYYRNQYIRNVPNGKQVDLQLPTEEGTLATQEWAMDYVDVQIENIIDNAPETLDTFKEVATYIASDQTFAQQITANVNQNRERITALDNTKANRSELFSKDYDELINAPEKINIVVRDVISADTYNEAREIQIGSDKFKFGSGSKIKVNEFVDGTLPTLEYLNIDGNTYKLPNYVVDKSGLKLVAEGRTTENDNIQGAIKITLAKPLEDNKCYLFQLEDAAVYGGYIDTYFKTNNYAEYGESSFASTLAIDSDREVFVECKLIVYGQEIEIVPIDENAVSIYNGVFKIYEIPIGESAQVEKHNKTINALMQRVSDLEQKAGLTSVGYVQDSTLNLIRVNVVDDVLEVSGFKFDGEVMII